MESFRKEMRSQQNRAWTSSLPSWPSWPSSPSSFTSWQRSAQSLFSSRSSSVAWPWRPKSRWETFLARFRLPARRTGWIPSWGVNWVPEWPAWLQGKKKSPLDRDLWS
jgi:phosphatidylinositol glycan class B